MFYTNKIVWLTGASSGIGEQLALNLSRQNAKLILSSYEAEAMEDVANKCRANGAECRTIIFDLSKQDEVASAIIKAVSFYNRIDVLINNGGLSQRSKTIDTSAEVLRKIMEINFFSAASITTAILPLMLKQGSGIIGVTSSISGKFGFPLRSAYSASKHALHGFFETVRLENQKDGISVTIVCPGRIATSISVNALTGSGKKHGEMDPGQANGLSAEKCAERYLKALKKGKREALIGKSELLMVHLKRFFPNIFNYVAGKIDPK